MFIASKDVDPAFLEALEGRSELWRERAIDGFVTRVLKEDFEPTGVKDARVQGVARNKTDSEREAWAFGFDCLDRVKAPK
jgi:hypothetical protein